MIFALGDLAAKAWDYLSPKMSLQNDDEEDPDIFEIDLDRLTFTLEAVAGKPPSVWACPCDANCEARIAYAIGPEGVCFSANRSGDESPWPVFTARNEAELNMLLTDPTVHAQDREMYKSWYARGLHKTLVAVCLLNEANLN
jgi:hypothetical protein